MVAAFGFRSEFRRPGQNQIVQVRIKILQVKKGVQVKQKMASLACLPYYYFRYYCFITSTMTVTTMTITITTVIAMTSVKIVVTVTMITIIFL